jgi:hypothetical protein
MTKLLLFLLFLPVALHARDIVLSDKAEISVVTCGPSQRELYTAFGHSAFRVTDPENNIDLAYNYGMFNFNQPNFYLNFARGYLYYKLGVEDFREFVYPYMYFNRSVRLQVLNLTQEQKQKLFNYLQVNALPENQDYLYDYFYNNCATKIRDVVVEALGKDAVTFDGSYVKTDYTIRELTDLYLQKQPWGDLGIDICLGLPMDKKATPYEYMFLPDYIESGFDHATIKTGEKVLPIVKSRHVIYKERAMEPEKALHHPLYFFSAIALITIALSIFDLKRKRISLWFDAIIFGACGAVGFLLFFLWFFTDHNAAKANLNILWAFPLHLVAAFAFIKNPAWLKNYFLFAFVLSTGLLLSWFALPQLMHYALIPIVISLALRSLVQYKVRASEKIGKASVA